MSEEKQEKIEFQRIMNYKAYRRRMIALRVGLTVLAAGGLMGLCVISVLLAIILAVIVLCFGTISILVALGNEQTYTVYNTRIVIKKRGDGKRKIVPLENVSKISWRRAFYERGLATDTVTITAKTESGKTKKYRMRHIFDAKPVVEFINAAIVNKGNSENEA